MKNASSLRQKSVVPLVALVLISSLAIVGDEAASMSMVLTAVDQGQPWMVTWFSLSLAIPAMILAPFGGAIVDRYDPRKIWVACLALQSLCIGIASLQDDFWSRVALLAASNVINILSSSAAFALLPSLIGSVRIERANSLMAIGSSLAYMVGPALSAWLFDIVGASLMLGVNAGTTAILAATALMLVLRVDRPESTEDDSWNLFGGVRDGWQAIRSSPVVAATMPLLILIMISTSIEAVAGVFWLRQISGTDTLYGLVLSCWAVGSIIGAYLAGTKRLAPRTMLLIVGGGLCMALAILTEGLVPIAIIIAGAFVIGGLGNGTHNVGVRNLIFQQIPKAHIGSAWAYYRMLTSASVAIGYIVGTPRTPGDAQGMVVIAGVCALLGVLVAIIALRLLRLRRRNTTTQETPAPEDRADPSTTISN
ncbi:MFS transporter [Paeniglutamicibacter gangotriensis]|uniref:Major facilitator superfamily transporter n=1 Tax=Paeniglutamicibacter gangotriensis Lz1y TaxID=1276920 RepID=M7NDK7_9MICC|nr:MFS transporter [Paeniglutamicibacter gangotriensis]EMQ96598.1 major facilitator superfamily transporter [Paeniglutamicibacter gangotriensis Lz1y]